MPVIMRRMKLRELLEQKAGIHSSVELRKRIGGSAAQISNLWAGRDTMGARLMLRILKAFPEITIDDLAQVEEAKKALEPPKSPKSRRRSSEPPDA